MTTKLFAICCIASLALPAVPSRAQGKGSRRTSKAPTIELLEGGALKIGGLPVILGETPIKSILDNVKGLRLIKEIRGEDCYVHEEFGLTAMVPAGKRIITKFQVHFIDYPDDASDCLPDSPYSGEVVVGGFKVSAQTNWMDLYKKATKDTGSQKQPWIGYRLKTGNYELSAGPKGIKMRFDSKRPKNYDKELRRISKLKGQKRKDATARLIASIPKEYIRLAIMPTAGRGEDRTIRSIQAIYR